MFESNNSGWHRMRWGAANRRPRNKIGHDNRTRPPPRKLRHILASALGNFVIAVQQGTTEKSAVCKSTSQASNELHKEFLEVSCKQGHLGSEYLDYNLPRRRSPINGYSGSGVITRRIAESRMLW